MVFMNPLWLLSSWAILMAAGWQILYPSVVIKTKQSNFLPLLRNYLVYLAPVLGLSLVINGLGSIIRMDHRLIGTVLLTILLLVLIYSRQAVILHENRQLFQKMENLAITDPLTTLYNRHSFNETIDREINRTNRHGHALSLLIIDVDHFKTYNDNFGHLKGDQMLHDVSLAIKDCTRKTDFLARYGGDEFVLILPETNLEDARWVSEKIQKIVLERLSRDNLSVSIGIALYKPGTTEQALVGEADANLYQQKHLKMVGNNP
jgi:diguanylate cyclase (GGDEF)-like protein